MKVVTLFQDADGKTRSYNNFEGSTTQIFVAKMTGKHGNEEQAIKNLSIELETIEVTSGSEVKTIRGIICETKSLAETKAQKVNKEASKVKMRREGTQPAHFKSQQRDRVWG